MRVRARALVFLSLAPNNVSVRWVDAKQRFPGLIGVSEAKNLLQTGSSASATASSGTSPTGPGLRQLGFGAAGLGASVQSCH